MPDLLFDTLPALPQIAQLTTLARAVWEDPAVIALWLGGSLARAAGDAYSDVDLRITVAPDALSELIAAAQWSQAEVARVGRQLAARYSIEYPERLEATVKRSWASFKTK